MAGGAWWRDAVLYQVYPRSFADSGGDGVGDLRGVLERLDHLEWLGVDAVWLSPFYPSPQADFGYDISDYESVAPEHGTLADFDELVEQAHRRGIRVVLDLVMNHTSDEHPWFTASRSGRDDPKRDWYLWADPAPGGGPPNNWLSAFERCGPAWTLDEATGQYYLHSFTPGQPDLNWRNDEVRDAMRAVWRFWLERGADGFRVDVAHRLLKDPLLRDNDVEVASARRHVSHPSVRQRNIDLPEVHDVLRDLRSVLDEHGAFALGEVPISDDARLAAYFGGDGMQTAFHVAFWEQPWDAAAFRRCVEGLARAARPDALATYALATHDIPRTAERYGAGSGEDAGIGAARARVAAVLALTLRGVPCVYYGEEIGMGHAVLPPGGEHDVDGRDGQRAPMSWTADGGFTTGTPWLPHARDVAEVNVAAQRGDPRSLLALYRSLIALRKESKALREGTQRLLDAPEGVFAYLREAGPERVLVALNLTGELVRFAVPGGAAGVVALSSDPDRPAGSFSPDPLLLGALEGRVVRVGQP
ncbi:MULTISPECIES: alpha-amylase family glycosyl hydrolase [Actinosynnema]|uniref:alpha-amylase family glycosyl hydrolase n=1 Tax=Actinosynnema TaxID=40566 RepID=UPI0020A42C9E|nr:alpha-amylase family glycosyl hydrolase [Actinosynnema pretiosum]MCP2098735.1 alpha-glucosidase [Actinosynnema pretiosum]